MRPAPAGTDVHAAPWADHAKAPGISWADRGGAPVTPRPHDADKSDPQTELPARELPFQAAATERGLRGMGHARLGDTALVPVSEPHGYLLTAAGLAVIGVIVRRRRRR